MRLILPPGCTVLLLHMTVYDRLRASLAISTRPVAPPAKFSLGSLRYSLDFASILPFEMRSHCGIRMQVLSPLTGIVRFPRSHTIFTRRLRSLRLSNELAASAELRGIGRGQTNVIYHGIHLGDAMALLFRSAPSYICVGGGFREAMLEERFVYYLDESELGDEKHQLIVRYHVADTNLMESCVQ